MFCMLGSTWRCNSTNISVEKKATHTCTQHTNSKRANLLLKKPSRLYIKAVQWETWSQIGRQLASIQSIAFVPEAGNHAWGGNDPNGWLPPFWSGLGQLQLSWKCSCLGGRQGAYSSPLSCRNLYPIPSCSRWDIHPSPQSQQGLPHSVSDCNKSLQQLTQW